MMGERRLPELDEYKILLDMRSLSVTPFRSVLGFSSEQQGVQRRGSFLVLQYKIDNGAGI